MKSKILIAINALLLSLTINVYAAKDVVVRTNPIKGDPELNNFMGDLTDRIMPLAMTVGGFVILLAVIKAGFDMIKHRKDADKRKEILHSFLWLAVGAFIIGSAVVITGIIYNMFMK